MDFIDFESVIPHQQPTFYQEEDEVYENTNLNDHACHRCDRVFSNFIAKIQHLAFSANHNHCRNEDYDSEEILNHLVNSPDRSFCVVCQEHFDEIGRGQIYWDHIINSPNHHYCNSFQLDLVNPEELDEHLESVHFCCVRCEEQCGTEEKLIDHRESSERHWICHECLHDFHVKSQLLQHQKTHLPRNITCPSCNAGFASNSALIVHWDNGACHVSRHFLNSYICHFDVSGTLIPLAYRDSMMTVNEHRCQQEYDGDWNEEMKLWECSLCQAENIPDRYFDCFISLDQHMASLCHDASVFRCSGSAREGKESRFTCLSGLVQHVEDTGCGNGGKGERAKKLMEFLCSTMNDFQSV